MSKLPDVSYLDGLDQEVVEEELSLALHENDAETGGVPCITAKVVAILNYIADKFPEPEVVNTIQ